MGTVINAVAVIVGTALGMLLGGRLTERMSETVLRGLGLVTALLGVDMFLDTNNVIIVLAALLVGGLLGEWLDIEGRLHRFGEWLEARVNRGRQDDDGAARFIRGFVTASLLFCIGPFAILGSIADGLTGDYTLLSVKATLDGFASLAFASSLGIGVGFSVLPLLVYQGAITLLAVQAQAALTPEMIAELTATGGVLILGISISTLLEIKPIRVGNFLPALLLAPLIVAALVALGIPLTPSF